MYEPRGPRTFHDSNQNNTRKEQRKIPMQHHARKVVKRAASYDDGHASGYMTTTFNHKTNNHIPSHQLTMLQMNFLTSLKMNKYWLATMPPSQKKYRFGAHTMLEYIAKLYLPYILLFSCCTGGSWIVASLADHRLERRGIIAILFSLGALLVIEAVLLAIWSFVQPASEHDEESQSGQSSTGNGSQESVDALGRRRAIVRDPAGIRTV